MCSVRSDLATFHFTSTLFGTVLSLDYFPLTIVIWTLELFVFYFKGLVIRRTHFSPYGFFVLWHITILNLWIPFGALHSGLLWEVLFMRFCSSFSRGSLIFRQCLFLSLQENFFFVLKKDPLRSVLVDLHMTVSPIHIFFEV